MGIPIENIYYLLSYAWNKLEEAEPKEVSQIDNKNAINLFARYCLVEHPIYCEEA